MIVATFLGFAPAQACSSDTAIAMAQSVRARAARLVPADTDLVGLGATAALVVDHLSEGVDLVDLQLTVAEDRPLDARAICSLVDRIHLPE
mgnify:CR=1 FL=1